VFENYLNLRISQLLTSHFLAKHSSTVIQGASLTAVGWIARRGGSKKGKEK